MYNCRFILNFEDEKKDVDILAELETLPQISDIYEFEIDGDTRELLKVNQINKVIKTGIRVPEEDAFKGYVSYDIYCYEK